MKYQDKDLQNENVENLSPDGETVRRITPEEGQRLIEESNRARRKFRQYLRKMEKLGLYKRDKKD